MRVSRLPCAARSAATSDARNAASAGFVWPLADRAQRQVQRRRSSATPRGSGARRTRAPSAGTGTSGSRARRARARARAPARARASRTRASRQAPGVERGRHGGGEQARRRECDRCPSAAKRAQVAAAGARALARDRERAVVARAVHQDGHLAGGPVHVRLEHLQREADRAGGVGGVAARGEQRRAGLRRQVVSGRDGAAVALQDRTGAFGHARDSTRPRAFSCRGACVTLPRPCRARSDSPRSPRSCSCSGSACCSRCCRS